MSTGRRNGLVPRTQHLRRCSAFPPLFVVTYSLPPSCRALLNVKFDTTNESKNCRVGAKLVVEQRSRWVECYMMRVGTGSL